MTTEWANLIDQRAEAVRRFATRGPGFIRKLADGSAALDSPARPSAINRTKMTVSGVFTTQDVDRANDTVVTAGIDISKHAKNPAVYLDHDRSVPVGLARDSDGNHTVELDAANGVGKTTTYFHQSLPDAVHVFELIDMGALNALSIGFGVKRCSPQADESGKSRWGGMVIEESELWEISHCPLGENADCLVIAVEKGLGGRRLSPQLVKTLTPLLPERKTVFNGATLPDTKGLPMADATKPERPSSHEDAYEWDNVAWRLKAGFKVLFEGKPAFNGFEVADGQYRLKAGHVIQKDADAPAEGEYIDQPTPAADDDAPPVDDNVPPGAAALTAIYDQFMALADLCESLLARQEPDSAAQQYIVGKLDDLAAQAQEVADLFDANYPDLDALSDAEPAEEETDSADDADADPEDDEEKAKRLALSPARQRLRKRLAARKKAAPKGAAKRLNRAHMACIKDAGGYLGEMGASETMNQRDKAACKFHAKELGAVYDAHKNGDPDGDGDEDKKSLASIQALAARIDAAEARNDLLEKRLKKARMGLR